MSHWNRTPRPIAIRSLLFRLGTKFILDHTVDRGLIRHFPQNTQHLCDFDEGKAFSRKTVVGICRDKNGVLVTTDAEYSQLLSAAFKSCWSVILLPMAEAEQAEVLRRMSEGNLMFRPSAERTGMFEYIRRNRLLLDLRETTPTVTVHCDCYLLGESK